MKTLTIALAAAACAALCGCFGPRLTTSSDLRQVEGSVSFRRMRDAQTRIDLTVNHLTQPEELEQPGRRYVAWVRADGAVPPVNIGALEIDKEMRGELHALTHLTRFDLFVTAEASAQNDSPTGRPLIWTRYEE